MSVNITAFHVVLIKIVGFTALLIVWCWVFKRVLGSTILALTCFGTHRELLNKVNIKPGFVNTLLEIDKIKSMSDKEFKLTFWLDAISLIVIGLYMFL